MSKKKKGGRKSKYQTHVEPKLFEIECWARDGLIDEQIARNLGVAYSTFREYVKKFPALSAALKKGKEVVDYEVENALLKRALGYRYDEVTKELAEKLNEETGKYEMVLIETKRVTKEVQPDVTAQIFWLKNRRPDKWRDKQDIEHSGHTQTTLNMANLSEEELRNLAKLNSRTYD